MAGEFYKVNGLLMQKARKMLERSFYGCPAELEGGTDWFRELCPDGEIGLLWRTQRGIDHAVAASEGFRVYREELDWDRAMELKPLVCVSDNAKTNRRWRDYCDFRQQACPLLVDGPSDFVLQSLYEMPRVIPFPGEEEEFGALAAALMRREVLALAGENVQRSVLQSLMATQEKTFYLMQHDRLTRLLNRHGGEEAWRKLDKDMRESGQRYVFFIADLDHFKKVNDHFGHDYGDEVLVRVAGALARVVGSGGSLFRFGGEEIAGFRPVSYFFDQQRFASMLMHAVRDLGLEAPPGTGSSVITISIGITIFDPGLNNVPREDMLKQADMALYEAKAQGRNGYEVFVMNRKFAGVPLHPVLESRRVEARAFGAN